MQTAHLVPALELPILAQTRLDCGRGNHLERTVPGSMLRK